MYKTVCILYNSVQPNWCDMYRVQARIPTCHFLNGNARCCVKSTFILRIWICGMKSKHHESYIPHNSTNVVLLFVSSLITFGSSPISTQNSKCGHFRCFHHLSCSVAHTKHTNDSPNAQDLISRPVPSRFITASLRTRLKYSAKSTHTNRKRKTQNAKVESKDVIYDGNNSMSIVSTSIAHIDSHDR